MGAYKSSGTTGGSFRFGHSETLLPFMALLVCVDGVAGVGAVLGALVCVRGVRGVCVGWGVGVGGGGGGGGGCLELWFY
jgi:hypothetical protein